MKTLQQLHSWMRSHPLTAVFYASVFSSLATAMAFADNWFPILLGCYVGMIFSWAIIAGFQMSKVVVILLCVSLGAPQLNADEREEGGTGGGCLVPIGVGVVVVGVGGFVVYKVYKFCQKKFPKEPPKKKPTNSPPEEIEGTLPSPEYAASFDYDEIGSCLCGEGGGSVDLTTTVTLTLRVDDDEGDVRPVSLTTRQGGESWQDWAGFVSEMHERGLTVTGHAGNSSYSRNGQPMDAESSPFKWQQDRRVVKVGAGNYTVTVEASPDLRHWFEILKTEVEPGTVIQVQDTSGAASFYRYRSLRTD